MKRRKLLALLLAACMVLSLLPAVAAADEEVYYTLDGTQTGGSNGYATESEITQNNITWMVTGNTTMSPWRIGGKNLSREDRPVYSTQPMGETVTKVEVEVGTINLEKVNSFSLIVASNSSFTTIIYEKEVTSVTANSTVTFTPSDGKEWTNAYYKFVFNVDAGSSNQFIQFKSAKFYKTASGTPAPTYTVSFDANGGTGTMANVTTASPYTLPACGFTAPEGKEFDYWAVDGDESMYAPGNSYTLTGNTTFIAQWKDLPVVNYTDMMLKRMPANGDTVVIYYPKASKVMTAESYYYNNKKYELAAANATLTDNVLAVPDEAVRLTVSVADGKYTFETADGKYLEADGTNVQLVSAQSANTLFQLETAAAGTDNYYIKCDSATFNGSAQYIEYYGGYFTVYTLNTSNTPIFTFQFFSEGGEGPTPETTYTVTLNPGEAGGDPQIIEGVTSPYTLPNCPFTAPEGYIFAGWALGGTVYAVGTEVVLTNNTAFTATWKQLEARTYELVTSAAGLVDGGTYLIASELFADEIYLMSKQTTNNRAQYKVTGVEGTTLTLDKSWIATDKSNELAFEFTLGGDSSGWSFYDAVTGGYLYAASSSANNLRTKTELDTNGIFIIAYAGDDGATVPVAQGENTHGYMHYNGENNLFSCYAEDSHITGAVYLYKLVEDEPIPATEPYFASQNLILDGLIGVSFNMELPEISGVDYSTSYMTFSVPHGTCTERVDYSRSRLKKSSQTQAFVCYVNAAMMAEPITATFHYTQDGTEKTVEKVYAVKDYFTAYDENKAQFDAKTQAMIESVADYGHYVQAMLAAQKGWTFGTDYIEMDKFYTQSYSISDVASAVQDKGIICENNGADISGLSFALLFDSATELRVPFKVLKNYTGNLSATVDGASFDVTEIGSKKAVQIVSIPAHMLSKTYEIVITTDHGRATVNASALSYVKILIANNQAVMQNAAAAIYGYSAAADAYKAN